MSWYFYLWAGGAVLAAIFFYRGCPENLPRTGKLLHGVCGALVALAWPLAFLIVLSIMVYTYLDSRGGSFE